MSEHRRWGDTEFPYWQGLIAFSDEIEIEAEAWQIGQPNPDRWTAKLLADHKHALRLIDELKIEGRYEQERERLAAIIPISSLASALQPLLEYIEQNKDGVHLMENYIRGLRSPDPAQRARFRAFSEVVDVDELSPREKYAVLAPLERAKQGKGGRPRLTPPWRNEVAAMDRMRLRLRESAEGILEAARDAAAHDERRNAGAPENRADRFDHLYRQRLSLRI